MGRLNKPDRSKPWQSSGLKKGSIVGSGLEVRSFLGKGAFGAVYRVKRQADGQSYALKIVDIRNRSQRGKQGAVNEIRVLAAVQSDFVIRFWEAFVEREQLHIVTEFAQGSDLARKFDQLSLAEQRLPEDKVWSYFAQLCLGLQALHAVKILHRDLKPANVLLVSDDRLKIADLGIAKVLNGDEPVAKTQCGTPAYFSPELWRNQPYDDRSDVWALGCILYEMLMMKLPFHKAKHVLWGVFSPPDHANDDLNQLVKRILVVNSKDRPDVNALLQHERVAALTDALLPAAAEGGADADAEAALEGAEDKDAAPAIGRIKVPRQKKALAGRDWLPSPRYATSSSPPPSAAASGAEPPAPANRGQGRVGAGQGTFGGSMAGQHDNSSQERLVPLPIPTVNEQAALRERFAAYAQQHQQPGTTTTTQHPQQHPQHPPRRQQWHGGGQNSDARSLAQTRSPRTHRLQARDAAGGSDFPMDSMRMTTTTAAATAGGNLPGYGGRLSARLLQSRPDSRESAVLRTRMSITQAARARNPRPPMTAAAPPSAREWLDAHAHQPMSATDGAGGADLRTRLATPPHPQRDASAPPLPNSGRELQKMASMPAPPKLDAEGEQSMSPLRSGSFPRSSGFGAFVMV